MPQNKKDHKYYGEQLYVNKLNNLLEMKNFPETYNLPRLKWEEAENVNRTAESKEIELVIGNLPIRKAPQPDGFAGESYQTRININPHVSNSAKTQKRREHSQTHFMMPKLLPDTKARSGCYKKRKL